MIGRYNTEYMHSKFSVYKIFILEEGLFALGYLRREENDQSRKD